jgi:hypothetical protein
MRSVTRSDPSNPSPREWIGSAALLAGLLLLTLRGMEAARALSGFPRFWHDHDAIWWGIALAATAFGAGTLARRIVAQDSAGWKPARPGRRFQRLILYTRPGCHLCDDARQVLQRYVRWLPNLVEVNIDHDPRLVERFGNCVPVVAFDGKVRFRGRIPEILLRRLIEGTAPK